jgi:hypothetical protein
MAEAVARANEKAKRGESLHPKLKEKEFEFPYYAPISDDLLRIGLRNGWMNVPKTKRGYGLGTSSKHD